MHLGITIRYPYRPEHLGDLADAWIAGNHEVVLEAVRLHQEEVRGRIQRLTVTPRRTRSRWSAPPVKRIMILRERGFTLQEIATQTNLSKRTICRILKKQSTIQLITVPICQALSASKLSSIETSALETPSNIFGAPV